MSSQTQVVLPNSMEGKTILVSGAAGFIPSHLSEFYLGLGATVIGVDNFVTGSESNIEILKKYEKFTFIKCDIIEGLPDLSNYKFDYVFSMASPASPIDFDEVPLEIMKVNSIGTENMLKLAKAHGARILVASTSEVYGDPEIHPQHEGYFGNVNTIGPRSCYDEGKRYSEAITNVYNKFFGVDTRIIRIFNTYGPRMRPNDGRVVPNFINQALKGEDITLYGDGSQTRSFCYVSDLVDAIHRVMFSSDHTPFNIGNPDEHTIKEAGELIVKALNSSSKIITSQPLPKDDPKKRKPDLTKIQSVSDYAPKISFEEGMKRTAEYFQALLG